MCVVRTILRHASSTTRPCFGLHFGRLYLAGKQYKTWNSQHKTCSIVWWWTVYPLATSVNKPFFTMAQPSSPTFETVLSIPHYNLLAHTFAIHTLPLHWISLILDLLASDPAATHDLLLLDQVNQMIVNLEWQLDEQHQLAVQWFSTLLQHQSASRLPQHIQNIEHSDCWHCWIWHWQPTPFAWCHLQPIVVSSSESDFSSSSSSSSAQNQYQMPSYPCQSPLILVASTSSTIPPSFLQTDRVYPHTQFKANTSNCLQHLQTVPEEQVWGMAVFPIVVEDPEANDDIF